MLQVNRLSGGYSDINILNDISFSVGRGEMFGILGPNGSGKTTLLKMISGLLTPAKGEVIIKNQPLKQYSPKTLAKIVAVLPQVTSEAFPYTVKEAVSLGRYAHQKGLFRTWTEQDEVITEEAMTLTGVSHFRNNQLTELSGGERQRVFLAQSLAQEPEILLLDEPTNHLDLSYQKDLLDQLKKWSRVRGLTVVTIFHDLNLASLYCDRLLLLDKGQMSQLGSPEEVLEPKRIQQVYETTIGKHPHPAVPKPHLVLLPHKDEQVVHIDESYLTVDGDTVELLAPMPLKTIAFAQMGSGIGWRTQFICKQNGSGHVTDHKRVTMNMKEKSKVLVTHADFTHGEASVFIVVITTQSLNPIHIWVFVNGELSEQAYVEAICTVTDIRSALFYKSKQRGIEEECGVVIAATQSGKQISSATRSSTLGKVMRDSIQTLINGEIPLSEKLHSLHHKAANGKKR